MRRDLLDLRFAQKLVQDGSLLQLHEADLHELAVELCCLRVLHFLVDIVHFCAVVRETHVISAQLVARINLYATQSINVRND